MYIVKADKNGAIVEYTELEEGHTKYNVKTILYYL